MVTVGVTIGLVDAIAVALISETVLKDILAYRVVNGVRVVLSGVVSVVVVGSEDKSDVVSKVVTVERVVVYCGIGVVDAVLWVYVIV